jgi:two-component system, OmpR family, sensor kinase
MSTSQAVHPAALLRRLLRAQLRLKVMAGVVVVTLLALVAFDVGAVTTMRRYLLTQTDSNLQGALTLTLPRLAATLAFTSQAARASNHAVPGQVARPARFKTPSLPGAFDMIFLPFHGQQVTLQVAAGGGYRWILSPAAAKVAARPGPHTLIGPNGRNQIRVQSLRAAGGSLVAGTSLDQVAKTIAKVEFIVTTGSIAVVLLIGLGVFVVLRRGLRPIEAMAGQADRITAGDLTDLTDRVTPHNPRSEVGRLGAALNGMLARIETGLHEREASQEQMRRFFADASHELRTPLASLRANAELYQQGALRSTDEVDEVMDRIVLETRRMGRLVDDMLRLARLGQHPGRSAEPVDLTAVVTGCAERARIADPERTWRVRVGNDLGTVGDEELLRRAVDNLLMNVLVHTPVRTVGTITATTAGDRVAIEVSDDGPGVPPEALPHIFERFYRAGNQGTRGSGLGLAIAAEIAAAHGGTAEAARAFPRGLRIRLSLPGYASPRRIRTAAAPSNRSA